MSRIAIADDDESMLMIMSQTLEVAGHETFQAANGIESIEITEKNAPDVLIVDASMPLCDGPEVVSRLRQNGDNTLVILITAGTKASVETLFDENTFFLAKPFSPPRLVEFVNHVLSSRATRTTPAVQSD